MISAASVKQQLKQLNFKHNGWGRGEVIELEHILVPDEKIYECVNGVYEGGFALLVATDVRVLLIDKKPLNYLTVEDLRFDMINEIDYSHRLIGARINIATGSKTLRFFSYNQRRLRQLITHVQQCMAEAKQQQSSHQEDQNQHLEQINKQLQTYLMAQYQYQQQLQQAQQPSQAGVVPIPVPEPVRPSNELSDYLLAQSLLAQHQATTDHPEDLPPLPSASIGLPTNTQLNEIYSEGIQEVFGQHHLAGQVFAAETGLSSITVNPLAVACAKLPLLLRLRKFGIPAPVPAIH